MVVAAVRAQPRIQLLISGKDPIEVGGATVKKVIIGQEIKFAKSISSAA